MSEIKTYSVHFCGCGGACHGLEQAGLKCNFAIDYLPVAVEYRKQNLGHEAVLADITDYDFKDSDAADLLWTSPPCQTFSTSAREQAVSAAKIGRQDKRDVLFLASLEYCKRFKPRFFVLENVMGLLTHNADGMGGGTLQNMVLAFKSIGYHVEWNVLRSTDFGLPQKRERVFIIGSRDGETGLVPDDGTDALGHPTRTPPTFQFIRGTANPKPWGKETYRTALSKVQRTGVEITVVDDGDVLPTITCGWGGGATRKKVAIADVTEDGVPYLRHPGVEEGARAQGFPDEWVWPKNESDAWTLIGNAVSSPVSRAIAEHLIEVSRGGKPRAKAALPHKVASYVKEYNGGPTPTISFDS